MSTDPARRLPHSGLRPDPGDHLIDDAAAALLLAFGRLVRAGGASEDPPRHLEALLREGVLARRHLGVLAVVALAGSLSVSELAAREGFALSTASLLVTQLADAGLVERHEDPRDRRRTVVSIAPSHRSESDAVLAAKLAPLRRALARMGTSRARAFMEGMEILVDEASKKSASDPGSGPAHAPAGRRGARQVTTVARMPERGTAQ